MLERILVPVDGSQVAELALQQVGRLLKRADSEVSLLCVAETDWLPTAESEQLRQHLPRVAESYVRALAAKLESEGARVRTLVREGSAAPEILAAAKALKASLIAIGTHGRTGLLRFTMGSVAEKVLRSAEIPVLVARSGQPAREIPFRRILVPVDGSDRSFEALPCASEFAKAFGAEILVLSVREHDPAAHGLVAVPPPLSPPPIDYVKKALAMFAAAGNTASGEVLDGNPASRILDYASDRGVDAIVMATHGRSGPLRWLLGSVTEKVARHAPAPVIVVRNRSEKL